MPEPATGVTPETELAQSEAEAAIQKALDELRREMEQAGCADRLARVEGYLLAEVNTGSYGRMAGEWGVGASGPRDGAPPSPAPGQPPAPCGGAPAAEGLPSQLFVKRPQSAGGSDYATVPDQVPISEPTTLLTDYLLAAVAIGLGVRLAATATGSRARQLWSVAFVVGGCAALAGGERLLERQVAAFHLRYQLFELGERLLEGQFSRGFGH